jgi:hypothetical protein
MDRLPQIYYKAPLAARSTSGPILNYVFVAMMIYTEYNILHTLAFSG